MLSFVFPRFPPLAQASYLNLLITYILNKLSNFIEHLLWARPWQRQEVKMQSLSLAEVNFSNKLYLMKKKWTSLQLKMYQYLELNLWVPREREIHINESGRDIVNTHSGNIMPWLIPGWISGQWIIKVAWQIFIRRFSAIVKY